MNTFRSYFDRRRESWARRSSLDRLARIEASVDQLRTSIGAVERQVEEQAILVGAQAALAQQRHEDLVALLDRCTSTTLDHETLEVIRSMRWLGSFADPAHSVHHLAEQLKDLAVAQRDGHADVSRRLEEVRQSAEYVQLFADSEPLVSVRIATYNKAEMLLTRALPSALSQTYTNIEVVIVGDGCTDDTAERIAALDEGRVRFENFAQRRRYPSDPMFRWMVAGSPGMNRAARLARGRWIAPLDDDDEFAHDHIERLLRQALTSRSELVYGAVESRNVMSGESARIWSSPPELGGFAFTGALVASPISRIFEYDEQSWVSREPGDWNLCRRMLDAGVRWSAIEDVVATLHMIPPDQK